MQLRLALVALLAAGASALVAPPLAARPMPVARAATDAVVMGAARSVGRLPAKKAVAKRAAPKKVAPKKVVKKVAPKKVAPKKPVASRAAPAKKVRPRHRHAHCTAATRSPRACASPPPLSSARSQVAPKRVAPKPVAKKTAAARTAGGPSYFSTANRQAKERAEQQRGVLAQV